LSASVSWQARRWRVCAPDCMQRRCRAL
jgi:hypothetical protein